VDETYIGGSGIGGKRGRGSERKEIAVIAVEVHSPKGFACLCVARRQGRVRMRRIPDVCSDSLMPSCLRAGPHRQVICDIAESGKHLDYYLDEYTFRFNRRTSHSRGMLFYRLMQQAVMTTPLPYRQIVLR